MPVKIVDSLDQIRSEDTFGQSTGPLPSGEGMNQRDEAQIYGHETKSCLDYLVVR